MSKYPLYQLSEFEYYFNVEELKGVQYKISFSSSSHLLPPSLIEYDIYEISFSRIGDNKGHRKEVSQRIKETISFAIKNFISIYSCPIIFICESLDNRAYSRLKLFIKWYNNLGDNKFYTFDAKELYSIEQEFTYYIGMIIPNNHIKLSELLIEFGNPEIFRDKL